MGKINNNYKKMVKKNNLVLILMGILFTILLILFAIAVDNSPVAILNLPENASFFTSAQQNLSANFTDDVGIKNATIYAYYSNGTLFNSSTTIVPTSGLIAHYLMNDNAASTVVVDTMGQNAAMNSQNTDARDIAGVVNGGLSFATTEYATTSGSAVTTALSSTSYSMSFWLKRTVSNVHFEVFNVDGHPFNTCYYNKDVNQMLWYSDGIGVAISTIMTAGTWYNFIYVRDGNAHKMYKDGGLIGTTNSTDVQYTATALKFGGGGTNYANTRNVDDVRIYNKALNQTEIDTIYNSGSGTENETSVSTLSLNVSTSMTFLDGIYNWFAKIFDLSGNSNSTLNRTLTIDVNAPNVTFGSPLNNAYSNASSQNLTVILSDLAGLKNATLTILNSSNVSQIINQTTTIYSLGELSSSLGIVVSLLDGVYTWAYQAFDIGNHSTSSGNNTLTVDTTYPQIDYSTGTSVDYANLSQNSIFVNTSFTETNFANITFSLYNNSVLVNSTTYPTAASGGNITYDGAYTVHTFLTNDTFVPPVGVTNVSVLVVAGGGGGGSTAGGGGGAGGVISNNSYTIDGSAITVSVGNGGNGAPSTSIKGVNGGNSTFSTLIAIGGGGGGSNTNIIGSNGGSGGGGSGTGAPGSGGDADYISPRQGYDGGNNPGSPSYYGSGGGGGAGGVGQGGSGSAGGNGGIGISSSINGSSVNYAGGGGGSTYNGGGTAGTASYGGGAGSINNIGASGTANTGGGGGGGSYTPDNDGGAGGSGIVIVRYLTPTLDISSIPTSINWTNLADGNNYTYFVNITDLAGNKNSTAVRHISLDATNPQISFASAAGSGGNITYDGAYTIHTFLVNETFVPPTGVTNVTVLVVAGGGGGGGGGTTYAYGGGGGAGGLIYNNSYTINGNAINVVVGNGGGGGAGYSVGIVGSNSVFDAITALGGAPGAGYSDARPSPGGSGGGALEYGVLICLQL